ncbi:MAG: RidA family protein [Solirubrobacterales bacterium]
MSRAAALPFSEVVVHGDLLVLAGQAAVDAARGEVAVAGLEAQFEWILGRLEALLGEHGSGLESVLRVECFLARREDYGEWNRLFEATFAEPRPARTTLVTGLVLPAMRIELQVLAARAGA